MTLLLGIETSCDETAVALVRDGRQVLAELVSSQVAQHAPFGGVIPEVASRSHLEALFPLLERCLEQGGVQLGDVDALAVTHTPGLVGCLLVGLSAAKGLSLATGLPLVPVNHVHAHIWGALMGDGEHEPSDAPWPLASLVVSGGHTSLYESHAPTEHVLRGSTLDDAAGEAYDKVSALLELGYPGGPVLDKLARDGDPKAFRFPRPLPDGGLDFSFSGLKTAVLYALRGNPPVNPSTLPEGRTQADVAASFQRAVVDVLVKRLTQAAEALGARGLVLCGGVAANSELRARAQQAADERGLPLFRPPMRLATDNAVMVAGLGHHVLEAHGPADLALDAVPRAE